MRRLTLLVVLIVGVVVALGVSGAASPSGSARAHWVITALIGAGRTTSWAVDIDENGAVVGTEFGFASSAHAFIWMDGKLHVLGALPLGGGVGPGQSSSAVAINNRGQVIGLSELNVMGPTEHAFLWSRGKMTDLGCGRVPPARCTIGSLAAALTDGGQIGGSVGDLPESVMTPLQAASWRNGELKLLGHLPGRTASQAIGVNAQGQVAGTSYVLGDDYFHQSMRAVVWRNGSMRDLGALPGYKFTEAVAINDRGQIVGVSYAQPDYLDRRGPRGFLWQDGKMRDLGTFAPVAINGRGQIIGQDKGRAILWQSGKHTDLGPSAASTLISINDRGQIIASHATAGTTHAALWENAKLTDLGTLPGDRSSAATAINNHDQIVGVSTSKSGQRHAVLWTLRSGS